MKTTVLKKAALASVFACAMVLNGCGGGSSDNERDNGTSMGIAVNPYPAPPIDEGTKARYLEAINNARAQDRYCGDKYMPSAPPLQWNDELYHAAYEHSQDMAANNKMTHEGSGTDTDWTYKVNGLNAPSNAYQRIVTNGYRVISSVSENVLYATGSHNNLEMAIMDWLNSPGHCISIMSGYQKYVGMAQVGNYWSQEFAY